MLENLGGPNSSNQIRIIISCRKRSLKDELILFLLFTRNKVFYVE